jgi:hypothetical protein
MAVRRQAYSRGNPREDRFATALEQIVPPPSDEESRGIQQQREAQFASAFEQRRKQEAATLAEQQTAKRLGEGSPLKWPVTKDPLSQLGQALTPPGAREAAGLESFETTTDPKVLGLDQMLRASKEALKDPSKTNAYFEFLKRSGYEPGALEPILKIVSGVRRGLEGFDQAILWGTTPLPWDGNRPENKTAEVANFRFDPWLQGGRLLGAYFGGIHTAAWRFAAGGAAAVTIGKYVPKMVTQKYLPIKTGGFFGKPAIKETALGSQVETMMRNPIFLGQRHDIAKVGGYLAQALPEGIIGGVAQGIREGNVDAVRDGFVLWYSLGLITDGAIRRWSPKINRVWERNKAGEPFDAEDLKTLEDLQKVAESIQKPGKSLAVGPPKGRLIETPEGNFIRQIGDEAEDVPGIVRTQKDADNWIAQQEAAMDPIERKIFEETQLSSSEKMDATRISQVRGEHYDKLDMLPPGRSGKSDELIDFPSSQDVLPKPTKNFIEKADIPIKDMDFIVASSERAAQEVKFQTAKLKNLQDEDEIRQVQDLIDNPEGVAARWDSESNIVLINSTLMKKKFKEEAWQHPVIPGAKALPKDSFKSYPEWEEFVIRHERLHSIMDRGKDETKGTYENRINQAALSELEESINRGPRALAPMLPKDERFFTYMSGDSPGRSEARRIYKETLYKYVDEVARRETDAGVAAQVMSMQVQRMAADATLFPGGELSEKMARHADDMHLALFKAIHHYGLDVNRALVIMDSAMKGGDSPKVITEALHAITPSFEPPVGDPARIVTKTTGKIKSHPFFNQSAEEIVKPLPGGEAPATPAQINDIQNKIAELTEAKVPLDIDAMLPNRLSIADAEEVSKNLSAQQKRQQVKEQDKIHNEVLSASSERNIPDPSDFSVLDPPSKVYMEAVEAALEEGAKKQAPWLYRTEIIGYGQPENKYNGLSKNTLSRILVQFTQDEQTRTYVAAYRFREKLEAIVKLLNPDGTLEGVFKTPARLFRDISRITRGKRTAGDITTERLHLLGQAIDGPYFRAIDETDAATGGHPQQSQLDTEGSTYRISTSKKNITDPSKPDPHGPVERERREKDIEKGRPIKPSAASPTGAAETNAAFEALKDDPQLMEAYRLARELTDEIADYLGLERGQRISSYLAHIYMGKTGRIRARMLDTKLRMTPALRRDMDEFMFGLRDPGSKGEIDIEVDKSMVGDYKTPTKLFRHLQQRTANREGYEFNYFTVMNAYIEGTTEFVRMRNVLTEGRKILSLFPEEAVMQTSIPKGGGEKDIEAEIIPRNIKELTADYLHYVTGGVSSGRKILAMTFENSQAFNNAMDTVIGWVGGGRQGAQIMRLIQTKDPAAITLAEDMLDEWAAANRTVDRVTGKRVKGTGVRGLLEEPLSKKAQKERKRIALKIDDMVRGLGDKDLQAPMLSQIYRVQMLAKLSYNVGFGIVNLTQILTSGWPILGTKYTVKGMHGFFNDDKVIHGKTARDLMVEMGTANEVQRLEEAIELIGAKGLLKGIQEVGMKPGSWSEKFNRSVVALGEYERLMDEGISHGEAIIGGIRASKKANFVYDRTGTPPALTDPTRKLFFMFQSYLIHSTSLSSSFVRDAGRAVLDEGLISAAVNGKMDPLLRQITAYIVLLGGVLPPIFKEIDDYLGGGETNIPERTMHPAIDVVKKSITGTGGDLSTQQLKRYGLIGLVSDRLSGPWIDTMMHILTGQIVDAIVAFAIPSQAVRLADQGFPTTSKELVKVLGLAKRRKPFKGFRGVSGSKSGGGLPPLPSPAPPAAP